MTLLTNESFNSFIDACKKPLIVDFSAKWCGPCKMMAPVLEELSSEREDIELAAIDIDEAPEIAIKLGIMSIPAFILFENGQEKARAVGFMPKDELLSELGL